MKQKSVIIKIAYPGLPTSVILVPERVAKRAYTFMTEENTDGAMPPNTLFHFITPGNNQFTLRYDENSDTFQPDTMSEWQQRVSDRTELPDEPELMSGQHEHFHLLLETIAYQRSIIAIWNAGAIELPTDTVE